MTVDKTQAIKNKNRPIKRNQDQLKVIKSNKETE